MTEYYENGPEGMPRVERMTRSTIMAVLSQKDVPTIYVSREEDYNSLCKFAHAVAEETLARVPAWPVERTTAPVSLTDAQIREIFLANGFTIKEGQTDLKPYVYAAARALLAAAPAPSMAVRDDAIQEVIGRLIKWETANGNDVYDADEVEELLALLQPQGQADTSGLPG